ncbi:MAG: helix-hairpin-helix domain-containing protein [Rhodothermales bacterium]|nr:helix-hairpin-helix domain-containing protein [Rhodothermales bacterium]
MVWRRMLLMAAAWLAPILSAAQPATDSAFADPILGAVLDVYDTDADAEPLAELLSEWMEHPLDVNTADAALLARLPHLGPALARAIVRHRDRHGPFPALDALEAVEGFSAERVAAARPFLTVHTPAPARPRLRVEGLQRIGRRIDLGRGYRPDSNRTRYAGSPDRLYTRIRIRRGRIRLGLALDKDAGESLRWDPSTRAFGFDHVAGFAALEGIGRLDRLVVGDFNTLFGQGVLFWRSSALGKSRESVRAVVRSGTGVRGQASAEEDRYLRGLGATLRVAGPLRATFFVSQRRLDGRLRADPSGGADPPSQTATLARGGLHRTPGEIAGRGVVTERLTGGALTMSAGSVTAGLSGFHSRYAPPLAAGEAADARYRLAGASTSGGSAFGGAVLGAFYPFGEIAVTGAGSVGGIGGVTVQMPPHGALVLLVRNYARGFASPHGYAFGERNGVTQNEAGWYAGLDLHPAPGWRLAAYFDLYRFPWARFGVPRPAGGHEALVFVERAPRQWLRISAQLRHETRDAGAPAPDPTGRSLDALREETRQSVRLHADYLHSPALRLRARLELVRAATPGLMDAVGRLLYQDVRWQPAPRLRFDARVALFDVDRYAARVYTFEDDLTYTFSVPAFSGRGQRSYLRVGWRLGPALTVEGKAAMTRYEDAETVGSGLDAVAGNRMREVRLQVRWHLR